MRALTYFSRSLCDSNYGGVLDIMRACDRNNQKLGVTGKLCVARKYFLGVIEGDDDVVEYLFDKIQGDRRHYDIKIIEDVSRPWRQYKGYEIVIDDTLRPSDYQNEALIA